jgi:hypothetical protein
MPHFGPERAQVMRDVLEEVMTKAPSAHSTPTIKAYLAQCILKASAQAPTGRDELVPVAEDQISVAISLFGSLSGEKNVRDR